MLRLFSMMVLTLTVILAALPHIVWLVLGNHDFFIYSPQ